MKAAGKGHSGDVESSPLMLMEGEAELKVRFMYWIDYNVIVRHC